jgi:hypothetical protein
MSLDALNAAEYAVEYAVELQSFAASGRSISWCSWWGGSHPKIQPIVELLNAALGRTWTSLACIGISHEGNHCCHPVGIIAPSPLSLPFHRPLLLLLPILFVRYLLLRYGTTV